MAQLPLPFDTAVRMIDVLNECYAEGFAVVGSATNRAAMAEAAKRLDLARATFASRIIAAERLYGLKADPELYRPKPKPELKPIFSVDPLPHDGEPSAEELIEQLTRRHRDRATHHDAAKLRQVQVKMDGPVALAFFGDPHIDDPGCAWGDLERDVAICRDTPGIMAVNVGDTTNNWVGRLMGIYAQQEVTTRQALTLIEWLMTSLPWLLWEDGNHDCHDMETEALTRRGWLSPDKIDLNDEILSIDGSGNAVWTPIIQKIERDNVDEMVSIESSVVSMAVTPNHRMFHRKRTSDKGWKPDLEYCRADALPCRFALPVSASSGNADHPIPDHWITLTGWFLTDGGVRYVKDRPVVTFYQSKPSPKLEAALAACELKHTVSVRERNITSIMGRILKSKPLPSREYRLNAEAAREFMGVAQAKGQVPSWVYNLSDRQFTLFLEAVIDGDGSWASNGLGKAAMIHGTKAFLDSLQAACVAHGWGAHLSVARGTDWRLNVSRRQEWEAERAVVVKRIPAASRVWCLRVPHGNFMVRRNGKSHFSGNSWNTQKGDVTAVMHTLLKRGGIHNEGGTRMQLNLPSGCDVKVHVRHDFPGGSQFNPAHALVRETLFGYRDHIMACGHRHTAGYIPVWHNDPQRLCHGLRIGTYKDFDHYAAEKGFQHGNWARSMGTVIDPDYAHDPVRFVRTFFSLEEMGEYLTWRREKWSLGKTHA